MNKYYQISKLHSDSIRTGFLSTLGLAFLSTLYRAIDKCPHSFISVQKDQKNNILGFISGTISVSKMYKWIILRYGILFVFQLILFVFNLNFLKKIKETLFYSFKKKNSDSADETHIQCDAELLSMAVSDESRGLGIGSTLIDDLEQWLKTMNIKEYKVVTFSEDPRSNGFYEKNGFVLKNSFKHHENLMNEYMKEI